MDINSVNLIGRLTRDAKLDYLGSDKTAIATFSIAVNRMKKDESDFFECTLWGKQATALAEWLKKGKLVAITGSLRQDRWEKDGTKHSIVKVNVQQLQLLWSQPKGDNAEVPATSANAGDIPF